MWVNAAVGAWLGGGSVTVTVAVSVSVVAVVVGHREGDRVGAGRGVGVAWPWRRCRRRCPSPQFHEYDAMVPSGSVEVEPLTEIVQVGPRCG